MALTIDLSGRVALVTGAASGIGLEIARTLAAAGAKVALADLDRERLAEHEGVGLPVAMNVVDPDSVREAMARVGAELGPIDTLVNNAGTISRIAGKPFTNQTAEEWERVLAVNTVGVFVTCREFALAMGEREGAIVNIASIAGRPGGSRLDPAYGAAKAGVMNFSQTLAVDLAPRVRVNCICPGMVLTPLFIDAVYRDAVRQDPSLAELGAERYFEQLAQELVPLQRGQEAGDIANLVAFLASDAARNITGQTLNVDGGLDMS